MAYSEMPSLKFGHVMAEACQHPVPATWQLMKTWHGWPVRWQHFVCAYQLDLMFYYLID